MRSLCLVALAAACGDSSPAKPDAAVAVDAAPDTGSGSAASDLDPTFGTNGSAALPGVCQALAVDASDRVLVLTIDPAHATNPPTLTRFDATGHVDASFAPRTIGTDAMTYFDHVIVLSSGKIVVTTASMQTGDGHLYRFNADGSPDLDIALPSGFSAVLGGAERDDGGIDLVDVGRAANTAFAFARITPAGAVDTTFGVKKPATTSIESGNFAHLVSLGHGTLGLTGESFNAQDNAPANGHLFLAADGAITNTTELDNTQLIALAGHSGKLYVLGTSVPGMTESLVRYDATLAPDPGFTSPEAASFTPIAGIKNGAELAVGPDGDVIATNHKTLDRFNADGSARSTMPLTVDPCDVAFDSQHRPLVGASTAVLRLVR